ncbi:MAG: hypothetical protein HeimC3_00210 [Candidatus Heimdallarchaeota archaeon LC_3]|nr:MAG: hypothetical protein HeimC3_00210 [Candidatus Heimdallarchaeota archaeon LC_3]
MDSNFSFSIRDSTKPRVEKLILMLKETRKRLFTQLKGISQETLDYSPDINKIETIGTLLLHITVVEWSYIFEDIDKKEMSYDEWKYAFALRENLDPIQLTEKPMDFYTQKLNEVRENVLERFKIMSDSDLDTLVESDGRQISIEWILYHLNQHESVHIGQINFLKRQFNI